MNWKRNHLVIMRARRRSPDLAAMRARRRSPDLAAMLKIICTICCLALSAMLGSSVLAEPLSETQAVEAGRKALDGSVEFPWYDSESDGIRRLEVEPPQDLKNRGSQWERKIKPKKNRAGWSMPAGLWTVLEVLGWTLLVMALAAVGYFLVRAFLMAESRRAAGEAIAEGALGLGDADRVESLPFQLKAPHTDLLSEARRLYEAGNYKDAIIYLYSYQLVELDKHQLIRLTKGKTNRQYLREVRRRSDLCGLLRTTMIAFEDVFFGNHSLDRRRFESCWSGLEAFRRSLEQATLVVLFALMCLSAGCASKNVSSTYGQRRGSEGGASVNGTAVLGGMFEEAGHRVSSWPRLSPKLESCQTIVWFPDDFEPPSVEQRDFLEWWLFNEPGRTVVYVGRDFDATPAYWSQVLPSAPPEQKLEVMRREATARASHDAARGRMPDKAAAEWFTVRRDKPFRKVDSLSGPWSAKVDAAKTEIELAGRLEMPSETEIDAWVKRSDNYWDGRPEFTPLLESGDDTIAYQIRFEEWDDGKIIVINNSSFLSNLPLVNREHRKLAGHLVSECGPGRVVFLESGWGGPMVFDEEPEASIPTGFEVFTVWPLGFILIHLTVLGILCCIAIYPIFGRPKTAALAASSRISFASDVADSEGAATVVRTEFGKHITALGELLELTEDRQYARERVSYYHEHISRDSGAGSRSARHHSSK